MTEREWDILVEMCKDGATNVEIGKRLYIAEDTVKHHVKHLLSKSGRSSRTALVVGVLRGEVSLACDAREFLRRK